MAEDGGEVFLGQDLTALTNMKFFLLVMVVATAALLWFARKSQTQTSSTTKSTAGNTSKNPKDIYLGLRGMMLHGSRAKFSLPATSKPTEPWGVLMDWGVTKGTASVVAMSDGSASVYLSSGGGFIGGGGQKPIHNAALKAVEIAREVRLLSTPVEAYPLPEQHEVFFYFLTDAGVYMERSSDQEMKSPSHPLKSIGDAMQEVITQYRIWDQSGRKGGGGTLVR
jgi:hypothetical protein